MTRTESIEKQCRRRRDLVAGARPFSDDFMRHLLLENRVPGVSALFARNNEFFSKLFNA